ncbi:toxin-antitoxin system HicB family antitoxin [Streptomyces sp. NPDC004610]|uniref:toxin-antitoxin system HicB family antitoxin n=1 Tax=unclassified Streptomyces TaxID=2593676 RepID=UPI0033AF501A
MELGLYVESLREELVAASAAGDAETRAVAERLIAPLESAVRLTLLNVLSAATEEITRDLAPGSVDLRLRGMEPSFVVTPPAGTGAAEDTSDDSGEAASEWSAAALAGTAGGATARINFRPPQEMKEQIEAAAARQGISVNAWMVRASAAALANSKRTPRGKQRFDGWVQ